MFQTEMERDSPAGSWLAQQFTATIAPMVWALIAAKATLSLHPSYLTGQIAAILWDIVAMVWNGAFIWGVGFYLGILVQKRFPKAVQAGRWVWVLPVIFFSIFFVHDAMTFSFAAAFSEFFAPGDEGEAWWAVGLMTFPTFSSILYAIGAIVASKKWPPEMNPTESVSL